MSRVARLASLGALLASCLLGGPAGAGSADPIDGRTLVVLGDSYTTGGTWVDAMADKVAGRGDLSCAQLPDAWPGRLAAAAGLTEDGDVLDVSCQGASLTSGPGLSAVHETSRAAAAGAFGPRTAMVAIQLGLNDAWGEYGRARAASNPATVAGIDLFDCVIRPAGCGPEDAARGLVNDPADLTGPAYEARIRDVVTYVRYYAPAARIVLVGYPEIHVPGEDSVCFGILGLRVTQPRAAAYTEYLDRLDSAQRETARSLGVDFFDTRAATAGHGSCSDRPWVNGFADPTTDPIGIPFHPNASADEATARGLLSLLPQR
ncbi:SGNH/GDSL hydrolase family protein [Nocardia aurantia]|uniref:SGNH hydrolase-type esterase domain-containing protein n=1 Tax=Nocardia aurantia TaxID=2585199 RepID=A0A7K0DYV8_9NOCA|nr:SGNH/GDSL hydrolase family protein [Nocardia aurantia]MQY30707.1 hypothetical protein [Nocardia aurantia]